MSITVSDEDYAAYTEERIKLYAACRDYRAQLDQILQDPETFPSRLAAANATITELRAELLALHGQTQEGGK